jgi:hypothetical protein
VPETEIEMARIEDVYPGNCEPQITGCVLWSGAHNRQGYGRVSPKRGVGFQAHRFAWKLTHGEPGSLHVLHRCDTPSCVNVDHLFLGTNADNMADKAQKGRAARTLRPDVVLAIRREHSCGVTQKQLAAIFPVGQQTISKIVRRVTWAHI